VECRAGTSIFSRFAGVGDGPVRIFLFSWFLFLAGTVRVNRWGWRDSTDSLVLWLCFGGYGTIEMAGLCCNFLFIFFSFMLLLLASGYAR
jgi:hypothetical protein